MDLRKATENILDQLLVVMNQIKAEDYTFHSPLLNASISQHVRHILEFYICLFDGQETGTINYDKRKRDTRIENDIQFTVQFIQKLKEKIKSDMKNGDLILQIKYGNETDSDIELKTNFYRELSYNIEHTIHHLAIIKQSIIEHASYIDLPEHFGIASSTVRYSYTKHQ